MELITADEFYAFYEETMEGIGSPTIEQARAQWQKTQPNLYSFSFEVCSAYDATVGAWATTIVLTLYRIFRSHSLAPMKKIPSFSLQQGMGKRTSLFLEYLNKQDRSFADTMPLYGRQVPLLESLADFMFTMQKSRRESFSDETLPSLFALLSTVVDCLDLGCVWGAK